MNKTSIHLTVLLSACTALHLAANQEKVVADLLGMSSSAVADLTAPGNPKSQIRFKLACKVLGVTEREALAVNLQDLKSLLDKKHKEKSAFMSYATTLKATGRDLFTSVLDSAYNIILAYRTATA